MIRHFVAVSLMVAALGTGAFAAERGGPVRKPEQPPMPMMKGGMGPMMAAGRIAAWDGSIYLLRDGRLERLNSKLDVVASVKLPKPEMPMMKGGTMGKEGAPAEKMPPGMEMRCKAMMQADIQAGDPQAILSLKDELKLTPRQVDKLQTIAQTAGAGAKDLLTEEQRAKVRQMEKTPPSMMKMQESMRRHMMQMMGGGQKGAGKQKPAPGGMMGPGGMMRDQDPPAKQPRGGMMKDGMQQMPMMQGAPPAMAMRCKLMMGAELDPYSPQALLALKDELKLTADQVGKLQTIADTARAGTQEVLSAEQKSALKDLKKTPASMMKMQGPMHEMMMRMMGRGGMMAGMMMHEDRVAADGKGVYVLAGGKLTVYNHDLKEQRSKALSEIAPKENGK